MESKSKKKERALLLIKRGDKRSYWEIMADMELTIWTNKMKGNG
jgi:hypothetical protein